MFSYKNYITVTIFSIFRWQNASEIFPFSRGSTTPGAWVTLAATPKAPSRFPTWGLVSHGAAGSPGSYNAGSVPAKHCGAYAALWFKQKNQGWKWTLTLTQVRQTRNTKPTLFWEHRLEKGQLGRVVSSVAHTSVCLMPAQACIPNLRRKGCFKKKLHSHY